VTPGHDVSLVNHAVLLGDPLRVDAYDRAIRAVVRPGDVVLDVGSGTGLLALLAARAGAARVHAVESMPVASLIRAVALANGLDDRIVVHRADLAALTPVEPVDVIVGEWLGRFVVDDEMFAAVRASAAWLKPGGRCIPGRVHAMLALVDAPLPEVERWTAPVRGLDFSPLLPAARDVAVPRLLPPSALLGPAVVAHRLAPPAVGTWPDVQVELQIVRDGGLTALAGWFEAELAPEIWLRTGPGHTTHWGQLLWPIAPIQVRAGDRVRAHLRLVADRDWAWRLVVTRGGAEVGRHEGTTDRESWRPGPALPAPIQAVPELNDRAVREAQGGDLAGAIALLQRATLARPSLEQRAILFENLGIYFANLGSWPDAIDALLAALDGAITSREQALRFLVACGRRAGWPDAEGWCTTYERSFGVWLDPFDPQPEPPC